MALSTHCRLTEEKDKTQIEEELMYFSLPVKQTKQRGSGTQVPFQENELTNKRTLRISDM